MGQTVEPGRGHSDREQEHRARFADRNLVSENHRGMQAYQLAQQAGYMTAALPPESSHTRVLAIREAPIKELPQYAEEIPHGKRFPSIFDVVERATSAGASHRV